MPLVIKMRLLPNKRILFVVTVRNEWWSETIRVFSAHTLSLIAG